MYVINSPYQYVLATINSQQQALFKFKRPNGRETRDYFSKVRPRFRAQGDELKMVAAEEGHAVALMKRHLVAVYEYPDLGEFNDDIESMKQQLTQPRLIEFLFTLVNKGLFGVEPFERDFEPGGEQGEGPAAEKLDFGSMFASKPIYLGVQEWNEEGLEENHYLRIRLKEPSAVQHKDLQNAQPLVRKRRGELEHREDVLKCHQIFRARLESIEGAYFHPMGNAEAEPVECTAENVGEWHEFAPYQIISTALSDDQVRGQVGNG